MKKIELTLAMKRGIIEMLPFHTIKNIAFKYELPPNVVSNYVSEYLSPNNEEVRQKSTKGNKYIIELYLNGESMGRISEKTNIPADKIEQIIVEWQYPALVKWFFKHNTIQDLECTPKK